MSGGAGKGARRSRAGAGAGSGGSVGGGSAAGGGATDVPAVAGDGAGPRYVLRPALYVLLFVLGVLVGVAGAVVQPAWFPGGLLLALGGVGALFYGGVRASGTVTGALIPAAGWLLTVVALTTSRAEGDFVFGAGVGSYLYLFGGVAIAVMCATATRVRTAGIGSAGPL